MKEKSNSRWFILMVVLIGPFMATLDSSIVNVALPDMALRLSVGMSSIQWVVTSYLIIISATILIFGRISDLTGKKQIYQMGFLIFSIGSLLCGVSYTIGLLIAARVIQAIGASMIMSCSQAIITGVFPQNERGRALGLSGTTVAIGTMLGPPLGGLMVGLFRWESIFLINVPIGIAAFILGARILPRDKKAAHETFDTGGSIIFSIIIVTMFWAISNSEIIGWKNKYIILSFTVAFIEIIMFYLWEKRAVHPLLDFSIFQNKLFTVSIICSYISYFVIFCTNIIHPFYLQHVLKFEPEKAGFYMMVYPLSISLIAPLSGYFSDIIGSEILTLVGLIITSVGVFLMSVLNINSTNFMLIGSIAVLGIGNGFFQSPNNSIVMSAVPKNKLGISGSLNALIRNLGMVSGIAFSMTLLYNRMSAKMGYGVNNFVEGREDVFIYAMKYVYITAALICIIGIIITFIRLVQNKKFNVSN